MAQKYPYIDDTHNPSSNPFHSLLNDYDQFGVAASSDFHISGISTFSGQVNISGSLNVSSGLKDSSGDLGDSGQILASTGSGINWIDANTTSVNSASNVGTNLDSTDADQFVAFLGANSGNNPIRVDSDLKYNPSTNVLSVPSITMSSHLDIDGNIRSVAGNLELQAVSGENGIIIKDDNAVELYFDGSATYKLATKTDGVDVRGELETDTLKVTGVSEFEGNVTIEDNVLRVGDFGNDNYLEIKQLLTDGFGFSFEHDNASCFLNEQGTTNQAIVLGDNDSGNAGTLFGVSNKQVGVAGDAYVPKLTLSAAGDLSFAGTLTVSSSLKDKDGDTGTSGQVLSSTGSQVNWINVGNIAAGSASQIALADDGDSDAARFIVFADSASGNNALKTDAGLKYNPSTNTIASQITDVSNHTSDDISEGSTNLYFTNTRARASISVSGDLSYNNSTGVLSFTNSDANTTYALKCTKDSDGGATGTDADPYLFLDASSGTDDAIQIVGGTNCSVTRDDDGKLTISSTDTNTDTNTTYDLSVPDSTTAIRLAGSDSTNDDITITGGTNVTVTRNNGNQLTLSSIDTTYSNFSGTTAGLVPTSTSSETTKFLRSDGSWQTVAVTEVDTLATVTSRGSSTTETCVFQNNFVVKADNKMFRIQNASGTDKFTIDTDNGNTSIIGSGTPTIESPSGGDLNITAATATFSQNVQIDGNLTVTGTSPGGSPDSISEGNTKAEVVDTGSDGHFKVEIEGTERFRIQSGTSKNGNVLLKRTVVNGVTEGGHLQFEDSQAVESFAIDVYGSTSANSILRILDQATAVQRFCVNRSGALGIGNVGSEDYGTSGEVLVSQGSGTPPKWDSVSGGGGSATFTGLTDTPANYTSQAGKYLKVNSGASALEFSDIEAITVSTAESTDDNNWYNIPFLTTTGAGGGQRGLQVDNGGLSFNPGSNQFSVQNLQLGFSNNIYGSLVVYDSTGCAFGNINGIAFGYGNNINHQTNVIIGQTTTGTAIGGLNVAIGYGAFSSSGTNAQYNIALGFQALLGNDGAQNVAIGDNALSGSGSYNIGIGRQAGHQINGAQFNIFMGYQCARQATTIGHSFVAGYNALDSITNGLMSGLSGTGNNYGHIAIGYNSQKFFKGVDSTGTPNIAMGIFTLENNVQSGANIAIGNGALRYLGKDMTTTNYTGGYGNIAIGSNAARGDHTGSFSSTDTFRGDYNTVVGWGALAYAKGHTCDTNTAIGVQAGQYVSTGSNNVLIGSVAGTNGSPSGQITTGSNIVCLGNNSVSALYCADTSISSSDARDKTDVEDFKYGLSWIKELRPITYRWDKRTWYGTEEEPFGTPDGSKKRDRLHIGFLAQEAIEVEKKHGYASKKDDMLIVNQDENEENPSYGYKYERLVPVLVNAIKELSAKNDALEARLEALES